MDSSELQKLAEHSRSMRQSGLALVAASAVLAGLLFVPLSEKKIALVPVEEPAPAEAFADIPLTAKAAIVYDLAAHTALYAKNADAQLPLASLTKLLTVYAAFSALPPDAPVVIPPKALTVSAPRAFNEGQAFSLEDIARLTLTASLNDGAVAIADAAGARSGVQPAALLAGATAALDLSQTYAINGSGLDENSSIAGGYGSARDLAILSGALVEKAPRVAAATTEPFAHAVSQGGTAYTVKNTDPMVGTMPRLLLSKTGYTDLAGGNLALVFDAGIEHPIAVVVLGSTQKERFTDGAALVAATLAHFAGVSSL